MGAPKIVKDSLVLWIDASKVDFNGPGSNTTPTTRWENLAGIPAPGVLNNFNFANSPWVGSGTPEDPYRLRANVNATNNFISWDGFEYPMKFTNSQQWTAEAWIILNNMPSSWSSIIYRPVYGSDRLISWVFGINNEGKAFVQKSSKVVYSSSSLTPGKIYHIVGVFDKTGYVYVNGVLSGSGDLDIEPTYTVNEYYVVGLVRRLDSPIGLSADLIALRVYSKALTQTEVQQNYNAGYIWKDYYDKAQITTMAMTKYSSYTASVNYASHIELYDENGLKINTLAIDGSKVYWTDTMNGKTLICKISGSDMNYLPQTLSTIRLVDAATNGNTLAISRLNSVTFNNTDDEYRFYLQFTFRG